MTVYENPRGRPGKRFSAIPRNGSVSGIPIIVGAATLTTADRTGR
jgi:hypothetical protein